MMTWQAILAVSASLVLFTYSQPTGERMTSISLKARKLPNDICGKSTINEYMTLSDPIAPLGAYPWMVVIGILIPPERTDWYCSGSLVTDQFVVTTASCARENVLFQYARYVVRLGDLNLDDTVNDGASPVEIEVDSFKSHPEYDWKLSVNDIGLVKLKTKVQFDVLKKPICLPLPELSELYYSSFVDFPTVFAGWGKNNMYNGASTPLYVAPMVIKDIDACRHIRYEYDSSSRFMDERMVCASSIRKSSCAITGGEPLMISRRYKGNTTTFLMGVENFWYNCGTDNHLGSYTRVSQFMDWITDNLEL